jgi:uncharacterized protein
MRAFIQRHPVTTYYVLVFAISWGGGVIVLGPGGILGSRPIAAAQLPFVYLTAIAGPSIASIVSIALVHGRAGVRDLLSRLLRWRVSVRWYAVALFTAPLLVTATLLALSLTPAIVTSSDKTGLLVSGIAAALVVPPFEELGWTGFAIPELRTRYGIVTTESSLDFFGERGTYRSSPSARGHLRRSRRLSIWPCSSSPGSCPTGC